MNRNDNYSIDLSVKIGGDVKIVFTELKKLQEMGIADNSATITFNGVKLPAGYYENFEDCFNAYESIVAGDVERLITTIPDELDENATNFMLWNFNTQLKEQFGKELISSIRMDEIVDAKRGSRSR